MAFEFSEEQSRAYGEELRRKQGRPPSAIDYANAAHDVLQGIDPKTLTGTDLLLYAIAAGLLSAASNTTDLGELTWIKNILSAGS